MARLVRIAAFAAAMMLATAATSVKADWPTYSATPLTAFPSSTATMSSTLTARTSASTDAAAYRTLRANVSFVNSNVARLVIDADATAGQTKPYVLPDSVFESPTPATYNTANQNVGVSLNTNSGEFTFTDKTTSTTLFSTGSLQYGVNNLQFTSGSDVGSTFLSGYGEREYHYFINRDILDGASNDVVLSTWNTDNGTPWKIPMYGVHPVVFAADPTKPLFYAVVFMNSHAQQLRMTKGTGLTFYAVGGRFDAFIIRGTTMLDVIRSYHLLIGTPYVPPYWSLGMHQCRWGWKDLTVLKQVLTNYTANNLPLEVVWSDIDYMYKFRVFTTDPVRYPTAELAAYIKELHAGNRRYVQIIDPGVAQAADYSTYTSGLQEKVYVTRDDGVSPLVNVVWPGWTVFPDFTSDAAGAWWKQQMVSYMDDQKIDVDGLWLDMNELASFCNGWCNVSVNTPWTFPWLDANWTNLKLHVCAGNCSIVDSPLNYPNPNPLTNGHNLTFKTLDMTGKTAMGNYYDTKAFFALQEERRTYQALTEMRPKTRPFLLSRATFIGSGKYTSHWTGDNSCNWGPRQGGLADSIQGCLGANLWGISQVGSDIGGFFGTPEAQLLTRWMQVGGFYTFMRNHHGLDKTPGQEPYRFPGPPLDTMRTTLQWRYRLLPFFYTRLVESHYFGGPAMRHISVNFPMEAAAYSETYSFMLGSSMLVVPIVTPDTTWVEAYVPSGLWYRLRPTTVDAGAIQGPGRVNMTSAVYNDQIPVLVAAGTVLPMHTQSALTVTDTRATGVSLLCLLNSDGTASGVAYMDTEGSSPMPASEDDTYKMQFTCSADSSGGSVVASLWNAHVSDAGIPKPTAAGVQATVEVRFAPGATVATSSSTVYVNEKQVSSDACVWSKESVKCTLPTGVDASRAMHVTWGDRAERIAVAVNSADDGEVHITKAGIVFALLAGAALGAIAGVVIMKFRKPSDDDKSFQRIQ